MGNNASGIPEIPNLGILPTDWGWSQTWPARAYKAAFEKTYPFYDGADCNGITTTFDEMEGFPEGRKERVPPSTKQELDSMNVPVFMRNFCSDLGVHFKRCQERNWPFSNMCYREWHHYEHCLHDDMRLRMKEFERERRLQARKARIEEKAAREAYKARLEEMDED